ncbi:MAG: DNA polymerase III subunit delta' [Flavobacteriales bacterium]|nr:DNA polymerase III subunit delta' [Flavobacteriales bacterium]
MLFSEVIGQDEVKERLIKSAREGRIAHAQLFTGSPATGKLPLAIAYAQYLSCTNKGEHDSCGQCASCKKYARLEHPDLHFSFPFAAPPKVKHPVSSNFLEEWRTFVKEEPYGSLFDWLSRLGVENKQGLINVDEAAHILKRLQLKPYESQFKIMVIWMPERMNLSAANKLLKVIEEPPQRTVFLLATEDEESLIGTIRSRTQAVRLKLLTEEQQMQALRENEEVLAQNGVAFVDFIRKAYLAHQKTGDLVVWVDGMAGWGRERLKQFLSYTSKVLRDALILNYDLRALQRIELQPPGFQLEKFAGFVHGGNIMEILEELNKAEYHIERNANAKVVLLDLGIKMNSLLHRKDASTDTA